MAEALQQSGLSDLYFDMLRSWQDMLDMGLTTFMERPEPSRSDCHAWSASPLYQFYSIICGIKSTAPGFKRIDISPVLGTMKSLNASFPHFAGDVIIRLKKSADGGITGEVTIPKRLSGDFHWRNKQVELKSGRTQIDL